MQITSLRWTYWPGLTEPQGSLEESWPPFADTFLNPPEFLDKEMLPGFSLGVFKDNYRLLENALELTGLALDYDKGQVPPKAAALALTPYLGALYTTYRSTVAHPRYRLLLPFSRPVTPAEHDQIWLYFADYLAAKGILLDESCQDASHLFFAPATPPGGRTLYEAFCFGEVLLDPDLILASPPPPPRLRLLPPPPLPPIDPRLAKILAKACYGIEHAPEGKRNALLNKEAHGIGGYTVYDREYGLTPEGLAARLEQSAFAAGLTAKEIPKTIQSGISSGRLHPRRLKDPAPEGQEEEGGRKGVAYQIVELALAAGILLWKDPEETAWASIPVDDHLEHRKIRSLRAWLRGLLYRESGKIAGSEALMSALGILEAKALYEGEIHSTYLRVAEHDGKVYVDLGDPTWAALEIDPTGWRSVGAPPVRFRRAPGLAALPAPTPGGSLLPLRRLLNLPPPAPPEPDTTWILLVAWLLAALRPRGPYPIAALQGEHGSAKSSTAKILRSLLDPNTCPLRASPREERDLAIAATNGWVLSFDNLSGLPLWLSDALCRVATGGGFAVRAHYENDLEALFTFQRPVLLNGIEDVATRGDLADRALVITLPPIPEEGRRRDREIEAELEKARPEILGAILSVVSAGLAALPSTELKRLPRMADFALWIAACEPALGWVPGTFAKVYAGARDSLAETVLEGDRLAQAVQSLITSAPIWEGTAAELLEALGDRVGSTAREGREWPRSARGLSGKLRRLAPALRQTGTLIEPPVGGGHKDRRWRVSQIRVDKEGTDSPNRPHSPNGTNSDTYPGAVGVAVETGNRPRPPPTAPDRPHDPDDYAW